MIVPRRVSLPLAVAADPNSAQRAGASAGAPSSDAAQIRMRGLRRDDEARRARSLARVEAAIASLLARGSRISLPAISAETGRLAPDLKPVAESTITGNPACAALYRLHAAATPRRRTRSLPAAPARLMRLHKQVLAAALIAARADLRAARGRERMLVQQLSEARITGLDAQIVDAYRTAGQPQDVGAPQRYP